MILVIDDGDTPEYVKLTWDIFVPGAKEFKALFDLTVPKSARNYDSRRRVWFVETEIFEAFLKGLKHLINTDPNYYSISVRDNRTKLEDWDSFFNSSPVVPKPLDSKDELLAKFWAIISGTGLNRSSVCSIQDLKPIYRKAAMIYHPDRNNGDGSKMSELNQIWTSLEKML